MTDTTSAVAARIQQEVLAQGPGSVDLLDAPAAVTLTDVAIDFGPVHAVRRVSFPLAANRVTALVGPSGCGNRSAWAIRRSMGAMPSPSSSAAASAWSSSAPTRSRP
jgi:ABC-type glutathione transport system ATPase component